MQTYLAQLENMKQAPSIPKNEYRRIAVHSLCNGSCDVPTHHQINRKFNAPQ